MKAHRGLIGIRRRGDDDGRSPRGGDEHDREGIVWILHGTSLEAGSRLADSDIIAHDA
jgi:hypothetical protein